MSVNKNNLISIAEANQIKFEHTEQEQLAADGDVLSISKRLISKNKQSYENLSDC